MADQRSLVLEQLSHIGAVLEDLPLPDGFTHVNVGLGGSTEIAVHGCGPVGLADICGRLAEYKAQRDEYENVRNVEAIVAGVEVTYYL